MKWKEVLAKHGTHNQSEMKERLDSLGDSLFENWGYAAGSRGATITNDEYFVNGHKAEGFPNVSIGTVWLKRGTAEGEANKAGYVKTVNQMFHEARHIWQHEQAFLKNPPEEAMPIVRRQFVKCFFGSIYEGSYLTDPGETDAVLYSFGKTMEYFESDPIVSREEAEEIMFEYMTCDENRIYNAFLKQYAPESFGDIVSLYEEVDRNACNAKYDFDPEIASDPWDMTDEFIWDTSHKEELAAFEAAGTGAEQDRVLMKTIAVWCPKSIERIPALKDELLALAEEDGFTKGVMGIGDGGQVL